MEINRWKWVWEKFGDYNDFMSLLELLGWKTKGSAVLGALGTLKSLWEPGNRPQAVIAALLVGIFVVVVSIAYQLWTNPRVGLKRKRLNIEFDAVNCVQSIRERHPLFPNSPVDRVLYSFVVHNKTGADVRDVRVEVERIEQLPERPNEPLTPAPYMGHKLRFERNAEYTQTFCDDDRDRVALVSYTNAMMIKDAFRIEGMSDKIFHEGKNHRIHVKVTGEMVKATPATFTAWVDSAGGFHLVKDQDAISV